MLPGRSISLDMKQKCDKCGKPATIHLTDIVGQEKTEKHLCEDCAATEGFTVKTNIPISQLLEDFVLQSSPGKEFAQLKCDICGMTFNEFREHGRLGCPNDYDAFAPALEPIIERSQEGAVQHIGKSPKRGDAAQKRHTTLLRLRAELRSAVKAENYELAASLRDQLKSMEQS
jgi:protein arginine kinase activator